MTGGKTSIGRTKVPVINRCVANQPKVIYLSKDRRRNSSMKTIENETSQCIGVCKLIKTELHGNYLAVG